MPPKPSRNEWAPIDYIVGFLALVVGLILLMAVVSPMVRDTELSDSKAKMVAGLVHAVVAIISSWVGASIQKQAQKRVD